MPLLILQKVLEIKTIQKNISLLIEAVIFLFCNNFLMIDRSMSRIGLESLTKIFPTSTLKCYNHLANLPPCLWYQNFYLIKYLIKTWIFCSNSWLLFVTSMKINNFDHLTFKGGREHTNFIKYKWQLTKLLNFYWWFHGCSHPPSHKIHAKTILFPKM